MLVRLSPRDHDTFRLAAQQRGISKSELIRRLCSAVAMLDQTTGCQLAITQGDKLVALVTGL